MFSRRVLAEYFVGSGISVGIAPPSLFAWRFTKSVLSSSEVDLSTKLMIMITVHEKSNPRGEAEEKKPSEGEMGGGGGRGINLHVSRSAPRQGYPGPDGGELSWF